MQGGEPLAHLSKPLHQKHLGLSIYEKGVSGYFTSSNQEVAIYLQSKPFVIRTDCESLKCFLEQRITHEILSHKRITKL